MRRAGKLAGVGALAVVALIGWTRHPKPPAIPNCESPVTLSNPEPAVPPSAAGERGYPVVYGAMPFDGPAPAPGAYAMPMSPPVLVGMLISRH